MTINKSLKLIKIHSPCISNIIKFSVTSTEQPDFNSIFFWTEKEYKIDYAENLVNN